MNSIDWHRLFKLWMPPLIGISGMVLLGYWFVVAQFFLFTHHLFWMVGIILLINPVSETFWPSAVETRKKGRISAQPSAKGRARREVCKHMDRQKPAAASENAAVRLVQLHKQMEAVDRQIEKLTDKHHANRN